ncbi:MAG: alpha/beta fold hydrolase [Leptospiraceae bacterium]|nr:alpha/beta fold hydrolase [Leptospiraceae bacterium]MCB1201578.1 alpha/beta fold hydrolase [Leptospiraceae bacterium]
MIFLLVCIFLAGVFLLGHLGLPEKINPADYQETPSQGRLMKGAEPYFLKGESDTAFLLVHGFEGSPYTLKGIGEMLHAKGHTVFSPLLPGHGTSIVDFSKTRYEHWYAAVQALYLQERPKYKHFFLIGFSMGGNLCLRLSIHYSHRLPPTGLVCISSPVFINGFANGKLILQDWRLMFSGIVKLFKEYFPKKKQILASAMISPWVGYSEAYATGPLHSLKLNVGKIRPHLKYIRCPICLIQASNDRTISAENLHLIYRRVTSKEKRAFLFSIDENVSTRHVLITHEHIRDRVYHYISEFIKDTMSNFDFPRRQEKPPGFWRRLMGVHNHES